MHEHMYQLLILGLMQACLLLSWLHRCRFARQMEVCIVHVHIHNGVEEELLLNTQVVWPRDSWPGITLFFRLVALYLCMEVSCLGMLTMGWSASTGTKLYIRMQPGGLSLPFGQPYRREATVMHGQVESGSAHTSSLASNHRTVCDAESPR